VWLTKPFLANGENKGTRGPSPACTWRRQVIIEPTTSDSQAKDLIHKVREAMIPFVGEKLRDNPWVLIEEIASGIREDRGGKRLAVTTFVPFSRKSKPSCTRSVFSQARLAGLSRPVIEHQLRSQRTNLKIVSVNGGFPVNECGPH
jgi:hypothetical protein